MSTEMDVKATEPLATGVDHETAKDLDKVQDAYEKRDAAASRAEHEKRIAISTEEHKGGASEYIKCIVFGALDGISTTFAIVAAAAGANQGYREVLVFGFANVLADAWSMGFGEFVSGCAEFDHAKAERQREEWEVDNFIDGERAEMIDLYKHRGLSDEDATQLVHLISKPEYKKFFVDQMMSEELGIHTDVESRMDIVKNSLVMFGSFMVFGVLPVLAYVGGKGRGTDYIFGISCGITGLSFLLLGAVKGYLTSQPIVMTALTMLFAGTMGGAISYAIGVLVNVIVTGSPNGDPAN